VSCGPQAAQLSYNIHINLTKKEISSKYRRNNPESRKLWTYPIALFNSVFRINIFLGLPDPDPLSEIWIRIRILQSSCKKVRKNLDSYCLVTSFGLFIFEK
jgi:hypothetical protein